MVAFALASIAAAAYIADLAFLDWSGPYIVLAYANATFMVVGVVLALRRPRHPIGWLLLAGATCDAVTGTTRAYAWRALVDMPGSLPGGDIALWLATVLAPPKSALFNIAVFLFPTGRLYSSHWRPLLLFGIVFTVAQTLTWGFGPKPIRVPYALSAPPSTMDSLPTIPNPAGVTGATGDVLAVLRPIVDAGVAPLLLLGFVMVIMRFHQSASTERLQLKWFFYASGLWIGFVILAGMFPRSPAWATSEVLRALVAVAIGIAILRYRLYDIDILINRTLVYGATTAILAATYAGSALIAQGMVRQFTQGSELAVAASTLLVAALIQPVRRRVQFAVDRRFYRARYDASRTVDALALRMRDEVDIDTLRRELVAAVRETMEPAHTSVWLRGPR